MRKIGFLIVVLSLLIIHQMSSACGCGGLIVDENTYAEVPQERAFIRWDGQFEDIVMEISLNGDSPDAALLVPLPHRPRVELADPAIFDELSDLTKPRPVKNYIYTTMLFDWGASGDTADTAISSQPEGVVVLERKILGALDVAILESEDSTVLSNWLSDNGYQLPDDYPPLLQTYVAKGWIYVAIKLIPEAAETLQGKLDPIWFSFLADEPIYPMQLTAAADSRGIMVVFYIFAEHRMDIVSHVGADDAVIHFADWVNPSDLADESALKPWLPKRGFLTKHINYFWRPEFIDGDFYFQTASDDTVYHQTVQEDVLIGVLGLGIIDWLAFGILGALGIGFIGFIRRLLK